MTSPLTTLLHRTRTALDDRDRLEAVADVRRLLEREPAIADGAGRLLAQLAGELSVPLAAATLLDEHQQVFVATSAGAHPPVALEASHCQYVIGTGAMLCLSDRTTDSTFSRLARMLIAGDPLRAYLGWPLKYSGQVVGAVCVADVVARAWTPDEQFAVYGASRRVAELLAA